jgi:hypothetical protein
VEERQLANSTLVEAGLDIFSSANVANEIMETLFQLAEDPATNIRHFTHIVIRELKFRTKKMPRGIPGKLRALDRKLAGESFGGQFARYVLNTTEDEDYEVKGNTIKQLHQPSQRVQKLAAQIAADPSHFVVRLPQFVVADGHRLYEFGVKIAEALCSSEIVETVIVAQFAALPEMKTQFIQGKLI